MNSWIEICLWYLVFGMSLFCFNELLTSDLMMMFFSMVWDDPKCILYCSFALFSVTPDLSYWVTSLSHYSLDSKQLRTEATSSWAHIDRIMLSLQDLLTFSGPHANFQCGMEGHWREKEKESATIWYVRYGAVFVLGCFMLQISSAGQEVMGKAGSLLVIQTTGLITLLLYF